MANIGPNIYHYLFYSYKSIKVFINVSIWMLMSIISFHKYLFKSYYIPGSEDTEMNKMDEVLIPMEYTI